MSRRPLVFIFLDLAHFHKWWLLKEMILVIISSVHYLSYPNSDLPWARFIGMIGQSTRALENFEMLKSLERGLMLLSGSYFHHGK